MVGEINSINVTAEEATRSTSMLEGCAAAIDFEGETFFYIGVLPQLMTPEDTFALCGTGSYRI